MPFLRFARDRRGYESTYLLQAPRHRPDQDQPRLLYWFRSPPHVKLGRAAFDEEAIRALEEQHPDLEFDWARILAARPPAAEPAAEGGPAARRPRRPEAQPRQSAGRRAGAARPDTRESAVPGSESSEERAPEGVPAPQPVPAEAPVPPLEDSLPVRRFVRVFDAPEVGPVDSENEPDDEEDLAETAPHHLSDPSAGEERLGSDRLNRLRGQYAAVLARISSRVREPDLAERLRTLAERANPDAWVTKTDVETGLAGLDGVYAELARHVGRRRRRRRRTRGTRPGASEMSGADIGSVDASDHDAADVPEAEDDGDDEPTL